MKKYIPTILIAVVVSLVSILGTYFVMSMNDNKDKGKDYNVVDNQNKDSNKLESGVKLLSTKKEGDKIVQTFEIIMNNKKQDFKVEFEKLEKSKDNEFGGYEGKFQNKKIALKEFNLNFAFNTDLIKENFNEKYFKIIKGTDNKEYLALIADIKYDSGDEAHFDNLYLLNDELEFILNDIPQYIYECGGPGKGEYMNILESSSSTTLYILKDNVKYGYEDEFNVCGQEDEIINGNCLTSLSIKDNKIYYMVPVLKNGIESGKTGDLGQLEERIYTINNNKVNYTVNKSYTITSIDGGAC